VARYLEVPKGPALVLKEEDLQADPYRRWAVALGWAGKPPRDEKEKAPPPPHPEDPWDVEFLRATLAASPAEAIAGFTASIEKKRAAAAGKEASPFLPAVRGLAGAQLSKALVTLAAGRPTAARDELQAAFFENPESYARLGMEDRARASFYFGHVILWCTGDEESAAGYFRHAADTAPGAAHAALCQLYLDALGGPPEGSGSEPPAAAAGGPWEAAFITAFRYYRLVRRMPNSNILTESYDFGSLLYPEERKASLELHRTLKDLEARTDVPDPFAHHALLFYLRSAQLVSWPGQGGGAKAREHREKLLGLALEGDAALLRDFYLLEGEVGPMEGSQVSLLPVDDAGKLYRRTGELLRAVLPAPVKARLKEVEKKLSQK